MKNMHCHNCLANIEVPPGAKKIVLAGNPNVGKSVFFNSFTGMYVDVSNFPGTTVDISHGRFGKDVVIDTPGIYGISSFNDEECVARDVILDADIIVNIVDAVHMERDLFLTLQLIDTGIPVLVGLNMMDEAAQQGLSIDAELLEHLLGVPVVATSAIKGDGLGEVKKRVLEAQTGHVPAILKRDLQEMLNCIGSQAEALLVLEGDENVADRHGVAPGTKREAIYLERRNRVNDIIKHVVSQEMQQAQLRAKIGQMVLRPVTGIPIFIAILAAMYYLIGVVVAQNIVGFTEETIMQGFYEPAVRAFVGKFVPEQSALGTILIGEFGLLTMTVTYILGLLLPLVIGFYFVLSIMEDSGYLPRLATLVDRFMNTIGLNGRAIIPVILGFGCVTMAAITTRILGSQRERTIAIAVLGLAIPCSAQLGVIAGMLAGIGAQYIAIYCLVMLIVLGLVGTVLNRMLPGESTDLMIDLPPMRLPRLENVLKKTLTKSYAFLKEASPLFLFGALLISVLDLTGFLAAVQTGLAPLTEGILKLPRETATAFIMGMIRRDFGAAGLSDMPLSPAQTLVSLITITLFVPCIASMIVILKERGTKEGMIVWFGSWVMAFVIGGIVAQLVI